MSNAKATIAQATAAAKSTINAAKSRAKAKAEPVEIKPVVEPVTPMPAADHNTVNELLASIEQQTNKVMDLLGFGVNAPSWKRKLAAFVASIALCVPAGAAIGNLAGYAIAGLLAAGGSVIWAYLIMFLSCALAFYAGMKIGQYVGNYVLSGQIDRDFGAAKDKVVGFFKRAPKAPLEAA